ncbi:hypothetical protein ZTR_09048 [Talaromyces verruculosus]|nr:hypothetical protein ZTR_09048 [Talaromyces verruculosus]
MSHLSNDDDDGYSSEGSNLTEDLSPEGTAQIQGEAKYFLSLVLGEEKRLNDTWERDNRVLRSALKLEESQSALHLCELKGPRHILDLGCGTAKWSKRIADKYPMAKVIGLDVTVDLLPQWVPPNLKCHLGDYHRDLTDKNNHFDLIHIGHLDGCVEDWDALLRRVYELLQPGGYVEWWEQSVTAIDGKTGKKRNLDFIEELLTESRSRGQTGFEVRNVIVKEIKFGDHIDLERRRLQAFADGLLGGSSNDSKMKVAITMDQLQKDDYMTLWWVSAQKPIQGSKPNAESTSTTTHNASRPINLDSASQEQEVRHSQYRSSDFLLGQGASKRSYREYDQDRISTSEPPSPKTQPLSRLVLERERVHFDLYTISNSSEIQEASSKFRRTLPSAGFSVSTCDSMTRIDSCGQTSTTAESRLSHYKREVF